MIFIENNNLDPALNHAIELFVLDHYDDDIFMLWRNRPCILIGRYQNVHLEVDLSYTEKKGLDVVRRMSGGGAIYCDEENMQYTFITKQTSIENSFRKFASPVVNALRSLNLDAEFTGRNDILLDGAKVSGNAQFHRNGKIVHHGTLLFKANAENLTHALKVREVKFKGKAVQSVASRIGFISSYVNMNVLEFKAYIEEFIKKEYGISEVTRLQNADMTECEKIKSEIFARREWNYGDGSARSLRHSDKYPCGLVEVSVEVKDGKIADMSIEGDFFSELGVAPLCEMLKGVIPSVSALQVALSSVPLDRYLQGMVKEVLINDIVKASELV